jgi:hypothetical protein
MMKRAADLTKRADSNQKLLLVRGIERVGFRANIKKTNIFLTGLLFFTAFVVIVVLIVSAFRGITELLVKHGKIKGERFQEFRNG